MKGRPEGRRIGPQPRGERRIAPDLVRQARAALLRVVDVALDLAGRDRRRCEPAVGEDDRVPGVLPALVDEAGRGVARAVVDETVVVRVAVQADPVERRPCRRLEIADEVAVTRPPLVLDTIR